MKVAIQPILNPFQRKGLALLIITALFSLPFGKGWGWVANAQIITTVAGNGYGHGLGAGACSYSGDGGQATVAELCSPSDVNIDHIGNIYISDNANNRIRKVNAGGIITTIAGNGTAGFSGDGGQAIAAEIYTPQDLTIDAMGNIYFADQTNGRVRMINTGGIITTIAGTGTCCANLGDGGLAIAAELSSPASVIFDALGNLYIADQGNNRVRMVNTSGIITTFAGIGTGGYSGDGGNAIAAKLHGPSGVAIDATGNLYITDYFNFRIRKVNTLGIITTIAGNGTAGFTGDGGQATAAELSYANALTFDAVGNLYIALNDNIRLVNTMGIISTIAGNGTQGYSGNGGQATAAEFDYPVGLSFDVLGNLYIADNNNNVVRMITNVGQASIEQFASSNEQVMVYPNPAKDVLNVECLMVNEKTTLTITDMLGNTVKQLAVSSKQVSINVSDLNEGVYTISINHTTGVINKRVVIVR